MKDEASVMEEPKQEIVKEEPCSQEESVTKTGKSDTKDADHAKPSAKETDRLRLLHMSPIKKRRIGANDKQGQGAGDKQPTLFSYFGKN